ncbi:hypothetical protein FRB93_006946 [Tulasnella sp. JGI-2019a]|nr:hypothetical protein FRB93_006946 [Tulasnella sp. JGI-2019a]
MVTDPTTQSNYWEITTKHAHFDWDIDWKKRILSGSVTHTLITQKERPAEVIFDTQFLDIKSALVNGIPAQYELREPHPVMGSALVIKLDPIGGVSTGVEVVVKIEYNTTAQCTAIGWLEKE